MSYSENGKRRLKAPALNGSKRAGAGVSVASLDGAGIISSRCLRQSTRSRLGNHPDCRRLAHGNRE